VRLIDFGTKLVVAAVRYFMPEMSELENLHLYLHLAQLSRIASRLTSLG
jgi:hypothetical protein